MAQGLGFNFLRFMGFKGLRFRVSRVKGLRFSVLALCRTPRTINSPVVAEHYQFSRDSECSITFDLNPKPLSHVAFLLVEVVKRSPHLLSSDLAFPYSVAD